ncbi:MAG: dihydrolipoamide acetyltransferase, partial [Gammaproteobacteria bacterium]|nr:dihydrolipoamide acetyltransferase [Gammaproteobacteria bacterium]
MSRVEEILVPDIGDFQDIPIIEIAVSPGDSVMAEDSLVTLESDKATMDVPSPATGVVKEMKVNLGDMVSQGTLILTLEVNDAGVAAQPAAEEEPATPPSPAAPAAAPD